MENRGPNTDAGRAAVRYNAVQHGILSPAPVIHAFEREEDWDAHRVGILSSLAPEGALEQALAERVASTLWRLRRVERFESESINVAQESVEDDLRADVLHLDRSGGPEKMKTYVNRGQRKRLLPTEQQLQSIARYEAHLNRQLYQALHELEALQARRHGQVAPLARLDVNGLPSA